MSQLKIYKASAGSGKTFTLTREFLFLLFENPTNYKNTLAVTFTNKATGEMKSRILEKLFQISTNQTNDYVNELKKEFSLTEVEVRKRSKVLLSYLLHDFSSFSVSTIDSFFQKIIRSFAREAGLESGFKIELNTAKILTKAIDHLLMKIDLPENKYLKNWLVQFAEQKLNQGKSWNLSNDLNKLGSEIFNELFQLESRDILSNLSDKDWMQSYLKDIQTIIHDFENLVRQWGKEGSEAIIKAGLNYEDFTGKSRSPLKYFEKLKNIENIEVNTAVSKILDLPEKWIRKDNPPFTNEQIQQTFPLLNLLLKKAIAFIDENFELYNTANVIFQNYYALGIIADIANEVQHICREENIFLIADSSHFLNRIIDQNETPFIYEKIGTRFLNFMIDEFQDTSKLQWLNFRPLVDNSLANNEKSLIVGDVKQSIYRWRNSDWNLLDHKISNDFKVHGSEEKSLDTNWRSNANIIRFNNSVFTSGAQLLQNEYNADVNEASNDKTFADSIKSKITNAYKDVFQHIPVSKLNADSKGYIQSKFYDSTQEVDYEEWVLLDMVINIEKMILNGYSYSDICILVRKKGEGETIANALLSGKYSNNGKTIPVVSNESLFLSGSSAINFLIAQIKYLQNPNNSILKADIILNKKLLESNHSENEIEIGKHLEFSAKEGFVKQDIDWINELLTKKQKPLLELVEYLANKLPSIIKEEQGIFIQAFINCTNQFIKDHYPDISAFIDWWEEKGKTEAISVPDDQNAIKIMTVHKSKGLEFEGVFIPFCNWKLDAEINSNTIWCQPTLSPFNKIRLLPVTYTSRLKNTIFKQEYFEEKLYQYVDSINMLYVAFTRSCDALYTYGPAPSKSKNESLKSVSDLLYYSFTNPVYLEENESMFHLRNYWNEENNTLEIGELQPRKNENKRQDIISETLTPFENSIIENQSIAIKTDSEDFFSKDIEKSKVNYGKIMHEAFEYIKSEDDIENALAKMEFEGKITLKDKISIHKKISELINKKQTSRWFNKKNKIKTESSILTKNGTYRPDRIVFLDEEINIIDYKFGETEDPKYEKQILKYIKQVKEMEDTVVKGFIWYVTLNKIVNINTQPIQGSLF